MIDPSTPIFRCIVSPLVALCLVVGAGLPGALAAQQVLDGPELAVNSYTTGQQSDPAVAVHEDGSFLIVWEARDSEGPDTDNGRIQGRLFASDGSPLGPDFQVNSVTESNQLQPAAAALPGGDFVVVWHSSALAAGGIRGQRVDASGSLIGGELAVNSYTTGGQSLPKVAVDDAGTFLVVWESGASSGDDSSGISIQGRRFSWDALPLAVDFQVNSYTTGHQQRPAVAMTPGGEAVVVWQSWGSAGSDPFVTSIQGQRLGPDDRPIGGQFQVNTLGDGHQRLATVAMSPAGSFVVAWYSSDGAGFYDIRGRHFGPLGQPTGPDRRLNGYVPSNQVAPEAVADSDGDFTVVWHGLGSSGTDTSGASIQLRRFANDGQPYGDDFQVNTDTTGSQFQPRLATDPFGNVVVTWEGDDGDFIGVRAQRVRVGGSLGDRVWRDDDLDGVQDAGEPGLEGVRVTLFDTSSRLVATAETDIQGLYRLEAKAGTYFLQFEQPLLYAFTWQDLGGDEESDSDVSLVGTTVDIDVGAGVDDVSWDAGLASGVGDRVWLDLDRDGAQDANEPGSPGVTVRLRSAGDDAEVAVTTSDGAGAYAFANLPAGTYYLEVEPPPLHEVTRENAGIDDSRDSDIDPLSGLGPVFLFAPGDLDRDWDIGLAPAASVGDRAWLDLDGNGLQDGGEQGLAGVEVRAYDLSDDLLATTTSGADGSWGLTLGAGSYYLELVAPSGYVLTQANVGADDAVDSDANPTGGTTTPFDLAPAEVDLSRDAGFEPEALGGRVWIDGNGNGVEDAGEPGLAGVVVRLLDGSGGDLDDTQSDGLGYYGFSGLESGTYAIAFELPPGFVFAKSGQGDDELRDSDADPASGRTGEVGYESGTALRSLDAGLVSTAPIHSDGFESGDLSGWSSASP